MQEVNKKRILLIKICPFLFGCVNVSGIKYFENEKEAEKYTKENPIKDSSNEQYIGIDLDVVSKLK